MLGEWRDGNKALHLAAREAHLDVVQKNLGRGASASEKDERRNSPCGRGSISSF